MGTWLGHAAPGTFFICFSLWWLVRSMHSYYSQSSGKYQDTELVDVTNWLCSIFTQ